ncbi:MAG: hypothetical protein IPJ37_08705 [Bacteroidales bacterium]|nr:hypothetical protein [Bacteroidales bacterium]
MYIEGMSEYLRIVTKNKKIMTLQNLNQWEILPENIFVRVQIIYGCT